MKIPVTFLGTGQAIPTARRNHTGILLNFKDENILIDCGEGIQRQMRILGFNPCSLTKILITHWHGDHILGIPGLLQTLALNGYNKTLEIYGPRGTERFMNSILNLFIFEGKLDIKIKEVESGIFFQDSDFYLMAEPMKHGAPCLAYSFIEKEKTRILKEKLEKLKIRGPIIRELAQGKDIVWNGKKIKAKDLTYSQEKKKITFIFDTVLNENCYKIARDSDLLVSEATYTKKDVDASGFQYHMTAHQSAEIAKKSNSKRLILSHLSQRYEYKEKFVLAEAKKVFKNTTIAQDLTKTEV